MIPTDVDLDKWINEVDKFEHLFISALSPYQQEKLFIHVLMKLRSIPPSNAHGELRYFYERILILLRYHMNKNEYTHTLEELEDKFLPQGATQSDKISRNLLATIYYYKQIQIDNKGRAGGVDLFEKYKGKLGFTNKSSLYNAYREVVKDPIIRKNNALEALRFLEREGDDDAIKRLYDENKGITTKP